MQPTDDVWDATAKATSSLEDLYNKIKVLSGKLSTKAFNKFMERAKLPQVFNYSCSGPS